MPPDMDLFGADLQEMLAPTPEGDSVDCKSSAVCQWHWDQYTYDASSCLSSLVCLSSGHPQSHCICIHNAPAYTTCLPPPEDFMAGDAPNGAEAPPPAGAPSDPSRSQSTAAEDAQVQHGPEDAADAAEGGAGSDAPKKVAVSRRRGVKRRANAPLVDAPNDMQIRCVACIGAVLRCLHQQGRLCSQPATGTVRKAGME